MNKMKGTLQNAKGTLSIERFNHFQCAFCNGWWGIGDAPRRSEWYCPWCGREQSFLNKTPKRSK